MAGVYVPAHAYIEACAPTMDLLGVPVQLQGHVRGTEDTKGTPRYPVSLGSLEWLA